MQSKTLTSVALIFMLLLLGQAFTGHLNQIPGGERNTELDLSNIVMFSNNSTDTDGDGIFDTVDACPNGNSSWTSSSYTDYDSDGCQDSNEDLDDDNDGILDASDSCPVGSLGWTSTNTTDYDSDGCRDSSEDTDDDNDGVADGYDLCPKGELGWTSSSSTDADGDGCRDSTEDSDGGGSGGGNYTSPCGSNVNYTSVSAYAPYMVMENQSFMTSMYVSCEILNATMLLDYWVYDSSNSTVFSGNQSWTGANNNSNFNWSLPGLSAGYHVFHANLY
ncbi:MAG: hypothetical protein QF364_08560, partial [Candidatus Poseidoniaceae archaeon]|nr:hypothetical protein [Candidatus Poseidoniaceae archaeon]